MLVALVFAAVLLGLAGGELAAVYHALRPARWWLLAALVAELAERATRRARRSR